MRGRDNESQLYSHLPPGLMLWLNTPGSSCPCLERIFHGPKNVRTPEVRLYMRVQFIVSDKLILFFYFYFFFFFFFFNTPLSIFFFFFFFFFLQVDVSYV